MIINLPEGMHESASHHYDRADVHSRGIQAALEGSLTDLSPEQKRDLAAELLRSASQDEGYEEL